MLAFAILALTRHRANAAAQQTPLRVSRSSKRSSAGRSRRSAASPRASLNAAFAQRSSWRGRHGDAPIKPRLDPHT